jgi:ABC-type dipeptide/oligopeptide/nickel transport system ATPase component
MAAPPILEIENLGISFMTRTGEIPAVADFSCRLAAGEAMGLVGESGCGKSTVALGIMRYLGRNGRITKGSIRFDGRDLGAMSARALRQLRGSELAMINQEPMASLNPAMTIGRQLMEVPMTHGGARGRSGMAAARKAALDAVAAVKLPDPLRIMDAYPHQLSGGQQQRVVIAMALMAKPKLLILDEPTTALDVTVEAGVVDLIKELRKTHGTSILFISHNLGLVLETCDRISVIIPARWWKADRCATSSCTRATRIPRPCSARFRCPPRTRTRGPWSPFPAICRCPMSARRAVISARAATISQPVPATPPGFPCRKSGLRRKAAASGSGKSTGIAPSPPARAARGPQSAKWC